MSLPRSTPSAEDVDARGLLAFLEAAHERDLDLHSIMVARHGRVVAEGWWSPYAAGRPQLVYSLSKSVTAAAVGFLVQEGVLALDDPVLAHLPAVDPGAVHPYWSRVTVRHCLTMTVGHDVDAWPIAFRGVEDVDRPGTDWLPLVLAVPPDHEPGTTFTYNQVATYLLSVVIHAVTGQGIVEVLRPRLLDPLEIGGLRWDRDPLGRELGFSGAHLTTEAVLGLAQLTLDRGRWQGRDLLDEAWFDEATVAFGPVNREPSAPPDWTRGYGFSFWMQRHGFRGDGAFGQFAIVLPDEDCAIAITAEQADMQATLDALWEHVLPALGRPGSVEADEDLADVLEQAALLPLTGEALGPEYAEFSRSLSSDLDPAYTAVSVAREGADHLVGLYRDGEWLYVRVASGRWVEDEIVLGDLRLPVLTSGGWVEEDRFVAEVLVADTPHRFLIDAHSRGEDVDLLWRLLPLIGADPFSAVAWLA